MVDELGEMLGENLRDNEEVKTSFESGSLLSYFQIFDDTIQIVPSLIVRTRTVSGDFLIWDNPTYGIWDNDQWASSGLGPINATSGALIFSGAG